MSLLALLLVQFENLRVGSKGSYTLIWTAIGDLWCQVRSWRLDSVGSSPFMAYMTDIVVHLSSFYSSSASVICLLCSL